MKRAHLLCVDDDSLLLDLLVLQLQAVGEPGTVFLKAQSGADALRQARRSKVDIAVLDLCLPDMTGLELTDELKALQPDCRVLIVTGNLTAAYAKNIANNKVQGCLLKSQADMESFSAALTALTCGLTFFPPAVQAILSRHRQDPDHFAKILSDREQELLPYLGYGWAHLRIARHVGISPATVRTHLQNIMMKLGLHNRGELMRWAIQYGFVDFRYEPRESAGTAEKGRG